MARYCLVLCVVLAVAFAQKEDPKSEGPQDMNERIFPVVHLPVGTLHVPSNGHGPIVDVPNHPNPINTAANVGAGLVNNVVNHLPVGLRPGGSTTLFRPWSLFSWFKKPTPVQAAQQAAYQEKHTPGKPGVCPYVRRLSPAGPTSANLCGNLCYNDWNCPAKTKCCPNECGYACVDAVFNAQHNVHTYDYHYKY